MIVLIYVSYNCHLKRRLKHYKIKCILGLLCSAGASSPGRGLSSPGRGSSSVTCWLVCFWDLTDLKAELNSVLNTDDLSKSSKQHYLGWMLWNLLIDQKRCLDNPGLDFLNNVYVISIYTLKSFKSYQTRLVDLKELVIFYNLTSTYTKNCKVNHCSM